MKPEFSKDVFFSYAQEDVEKVRKIAGVLRDRNITTFVADDDLRSLVQGTEKLVRGSDEWEKALFQQMDASRFFVAYCSRSTMASDWCRREVSHFKDQVYKNDDRRQIFVLCERGGQAITAELKDFLYSESEDILVEDLTKALVGFLRTENVDLGKNLKQSKSALVIQRSETDEKVREAFTHYGHKRFWEPISRNRDVHIFTCGRETRQEEGRGRGGRTNIDKWDYQTVLQITHFFAENYPATRVKIEDPVAKLTAVDLQSSAQQIAELMIQLGDKDCIIVGSPDVSDFCEIVLAKLHNINAFEEERQKKRGFAIVKRQMKAPSSTYWVKRKDEEEGIAWIERNEFFEPSEKEGGGETYGILVVCDNPFRQVGQKEMRKIIILAGFTGVATYGVARLITAPECLDAFFPIDQEFGNLDSNFEALVRVPYSYDDSSQHRDSRAIYRDGEISVEAMVKI